MVSFPPIPANELPAPGAPVSAARPASGTGGEGAGAAPGPDIGRLVLVGGIVTFAAACAIAAWLLFGR